ncbi:MAG: Na+/H+ antiporter subunit E [Defluviitaleaceae bacterium]|nr:Na+/H+ antiporter subunit E [Defluviitaleaceae bacterium]
MSIRNAVIVLALAIVWIILVENLSVITVLTGSVFGAGCVFFARRYLPLDKITGVNFNKLAMYPLFLVGQIFFSAIYVGKIIFAGARVDIVEVQTDINNDSLRVMLADSVTLTPGSLLLELEKEKMTILWLRRRDAKDNPPDAAEQIMGKLQGKLIKAQEARLK